MASGSLARGRSISTLSYLGQRIKQTDNEIVQMFRLPSPRDEIPSRPTMSNALMNKGSGRVLDERFIRTLKIFKWGPDAEKAFEVLKLKVDHRLVREVSSTDVDIDVKSQWAGKRRNFEHDSTTYLALIHCLDETELVGQMWKTIQDMVRSANVAIAPSELSEIVRILGRAKMVNKAISVFYQIKGRKCNATMSTYNSLFSMLLQQNRHDKVHELSYSVLISAFGKLGHDDSAIRLFEEMKENGLHPSAKIYTTLLSIYFKWVRLRQL